MGLTEKQTQLKRRLDTYLLIGQEETYRLEQREKKTGNTVKTWNTVKRHKISIIGVPEGEEKIEQKQYLKR